MNRNVILAIVVIAVIGVAGFGVYMMIQPVHNPNQIAIVFATGGLGDKSFNDGVYEGATEASDDFDIGFTFSEPTVIADYESMIRGYAAHSGLIEPYDLIICVGYDQADAVMAVAEDYPDQQIAIIDMYIDPTNYTNVASVIFTENQGSALVGAIAGMYTTTGKVGFLGGMDIPLIRKFAAGYFWGANYSYYNYVNVGVNITTTAQYVGDWADIATGKSLSSGMYTGNADIIFAAAGRSGLGAFEAALEENETSSHPLWVIGVDSPQMYLGCEDSENPEPPTVCLTSMLKRVDVATYDMMKDISDDTYTSGIKAYDLSNDGHDYEVNTELLTLREDVVDVVEMIRTGIINGTFVIPDDY